MLVRSIVLGAVLLGFVSTSHAAIIAYNETVNGDLPSSVPISVGTLDLGINTVSGTTGFGGSYLDFDSFRFTIAPGQQLTAINLDLANISGSSVISAGWGFYRVSPVPVFLGDISASSQPNSVIPSVFPQGAGIYSISASSLAGTGPRSYTFNFEVASTATTPEPASCVIWGVLGIAGLVAARRRKKFAA
ncbi:hypothetical protein NA78x_003486 [Anatilimnocola sp. NA78]|uniref:hypothetical protein n=1 Tax=Anatilimnocola sp. NA78 TaxID=3415683 RepID=UPI003CE53062